MSEPETLDERIERIERHAREAAEAEARGTITSLPPLWAYSDAFQTLTDHA